MPVKINLSNKKIGRLTFISSRKIGPKTIWKIKCDCGTIFESRADILSRKKRKGSFFECTRCLKLRKSGIVLGERYGRLTIISTCDSKDNHHLWFWAKCDCGTEKAFCSTELKRGAKSCGCYGRKLNSKWVNETQYPPAHGLQSKKSTKLLKSLYHIRQQICAKCYDKNHVLFHKYGALGVTVCNLWKNGAKDFAKWALKSKFHKGCTIALKAGKKEFNPENCYILLKRELIKKNNSKFIYDNKNISEWAKILGISVSCLHTRIKRNISEYSLKKIITNELKKKMEKDKNEEANISD